MRAMHIILYAVLAVLMLLPGGAGADVDFGGDVVVEAGKTMESAVSFGGNVTVLGTVTEAAVAIGGNVFVESGGRVLGDAVAIGGNVSIRDNAAVEQDAVTLGGELLVAPTGQIGGERVHIAGIGGKVFPNFWENISRVIFLGPFAGVFGALGATILLFFFLMRVIVWIAVAALVYHFFPENVESMAVSLRQRFWAALAYGLLILLLIPFIFLFLLVSLIGIPLIPISALTLFLVYLFGSAGVALWAGRLLPNPASRSGMANLLLGILVISLLRLIPGVGFLMWLILSSVSLGIAVISRFGRRPPVTPAV
ncbi:MAG: hypothetical protein ACYC9O_12440 [Candidatus Latescibacterota bacterium]